MSRSHLSCALSGPKTEVILGIILEHARTQIETGSDYLTLSNKKC